MDMSKISQCSVEPCSYNYQQRCRALAITVGDVDNPRCDTFVMADRKGGDPASTGKVGACKMSVCKFNESLECGAGQITVGSRQDIAYCLTFEL